MKLFQRFRKKEAAAAPPPEEKREKRACEAASLLRQKGIPLTQENIRRALDDIRGRCEGDPVLRREFTRIERPLVFFIDYTIKEGAFPFSRILSPSG